jgi:hypothetical protein
MAQVVEWLPGMHNIVHPLVMTFQKLSGDSNLLS